MDKAHEDRNRSADAFGNRFGHGDAGMRQVLSSLAVAVFWPVDCGYVVVTQ